MSHTVRLELKVKDKDLFKSVALKKGYRVKENARVKFFSTSHKGMAVYLPGWKYPVVITEDGTITYDNYDGNWGDKKFLDDLMQSYSRELVIKKALERGYFLLQEEQNEEELVIKLGRI